MLVKGGETLDAVTQRKGLVEFVDFIRREQLNRQVVLVAHNGSSFDFHVLFNTLRRHELLNHFISLDVLLNDSLKSISQEMKRKGGPLSSCPSKSVSGLYEFLFKDDFKAHDALEDCVALGRIVFSSVLSIDDKLIENCISSAVFESNMNAAVKARARKFTLEVLPVSKGIKEKLAKEGLDHETLIQIHQEACYL